MNLDDNFLLHANIDNVDVDDDVPTLAEIDDTQSRGQTRSQALGSCHLPPVPVTILTGFLGAGKTTLVKDILSSNLHGKRIAVIENEFGGGESDKQAVKNLGLIMNKSSTLSVETMIAQDGVGEKSNLAEFVELPNGCVCCTVKDSLVQTLETLIERSFGLDYIIIETSGMADPGPVASIFWLDDALGSRLKLNGIVACVDAKNILQQLEETSSVVINGIDSKPHGGDEAARQIAFADRVLVNKIDLLESQHRTGADQAVELVLRTITSINPTASIQKTTFSKVNDLDWILDANCLDVNRIKEIEDEFCLATSQHSQSPTNSVSPRTQGPGKLCLPCNYLPTKSHHSHTSAICTITLLKCGSVDLKKCNSWLASVLWPNQDELDKVLRSRLEEELKIHGRVERNNINSAPSEVKMVQEIDRKQRIYRIKGVLSVCHRLDSTGTVIPGSNDWVDDALHAGSIDRENGLDKRRFIVQAVHDLWEIHPASNNLSWGPDEETRCCKIVIIGKWLNQSELKESFHDCFVA